ncbi:uncharacterized protein LOC110685408 [Chenopodium quinoa]|uniref:uncharacterized protein LOC110685408 n=1 Tax=Chenopodium quinoa TaxID=63459 RepID=UPI000B78D375|nr:uncharacterized protein LOC110685408 [Chenopodium quinoa]
MIFSDKDHFISVFRDYCIQCGFAVVVDRSCPRRFTASCLALNCSWKIHSSRIPDGVTWDIKTIKNPEHTCGGLDERNPLVTVKWAAEKLLEDIRADNDISGKTLNDLLFSRYGVHMATNTLYKMRGVALKEINGGHDTSYGYLPKYCEMIKETNPGSAANCAWKQLNPPDPSLTFSSIFISFKAAIDGVVAGCRSLVGVDGAHLKGHFGGILMSAMAIDGNNELFPFAWAIVPKEDGDSWKYFFWHLKHILSGSERGNDWYVALNEVWPEVDRRYCCKHLAKNWKASFPGPLMHSLFWLACSETSPFTFKKAMDRIQAVNPLACEWLAKLGDHPRWTRHKFDPNICSDENKTNFVESFNSTLGVDRCRPVLTLLEGIRRMCMVRLSTRRQRCNNWNEDEPCPNIVKRIKMLTFESKTCKAYQSDEGEYEVKDGKSMLLVSLNRKTCLCGAWQIFGLPCKHAIRAILAAGLNPHQFCSTWFSVQTYKQEYASPIHSVPDFDHWPEIDMPTV